MIPSLYPATVDCDGIVVTYKVGAVAQFIRKYHFKAKFVIKWWL